jgi:CheY-like chemotaxis protein/HPt (histidine-containing phosphotransfer) domain-containing protein
MRCEDRTDDEVTLVLSVRDTGVGIPADRLDAIFESFTQVDGATTRKYGGTGLGLTISRQLVQMMGGELRVESEVGVGSTFSFRLRLPCGGRASDAASDGADARALRPVLQRRHVLVVDDNATNRRVLEVRLAGWGCRVELACDGPDALRRLRAAQARGDRFELVLLDVQMPDMDGYEVERTLRTDASCGEPIVVILSSLGSQRRCVPAEEPQCAAFLTKPVRQSVLLGALARALGHEPQRSSAPRPAAAAAAGGLGRLTGRVLLVEDVMVNVKLVLGILEKTSVEVSLAENGQAALELLDRETFDLILMDLQMPVMDGLEATRRIRAREQHTGERVPILAMTAHAMGSDRDRCLAAGMSGYLAKPIRAADLYAELERWLAAPVPASAPASVDGPPPVAPARAARDARPPREILDVDAAIERLDGEEELFRTLLDAFLESAPAMLAELDAAAASADPACLERAAHALRGAAAGVGAEAIRAETERLEQLGAAGVAEPEELDALRVHLEALLAAVDRWGLRGDAAA